MMILTTLKAKSPMNTPMAVSATLFGSISSSMFFLLFKLSLVEADYILPRTVNIRIDMRACSDTMVRINGRQDNRTEFVGGCLPGYCCYGAITVCGDDGRCRNCSRSVRNHDRSRGARSRDTD